MKIVLGFIGFIMIVVLYVVISLFSYNNTAVNFEENLVAAKTNASNIAAQYQNALFEQVQVPEMMKEDIRELVTASIEGRYGENGSRAIFQSITEQNPSVDPAVYLKIQSVIDAGRRNFEREQTRMIDIERAYTAKLRSQPSGFFMGILGFPKIDLDDFEPVTTNRVKEMLETGVEEHMVFN